MARRFDLIRTLSLCAFGLTCVHCKNLNSELTSINLYPQHGVSTPYNPGANAADDVRLALNDAKANHKLALIVMGANWCHDSQYLTTQFETPRFQTLIADHYTVVYVDVGQKNRNIDIARMFGIDNIVGTPTVFITDPNGDVLNFETAPTWRNASNLSEQEIWDYFNDFVPRHPPAKDNKSENKSDRPSR